jgi:hypothetical protein
MNGATERHQGPLPEMTPEERQVLENLPFSLEAGLQMLRWWRQVEAGEAQADKYPLIRQPATPHGNYGFFGQVPLTWGTLPVVGVVQEAFYDRPRVGRGSEPEAALWMRDQIREFVSHYFLRVCSHRQLQMRSPSGRSAPSWLSGLSLCPPPTSTDRIGGGYQQFFYREKATGHIRRIPQEERYRIVDLREIGTRLDWLLATVEIFNFALSGNLFGNPTFGFVIPVREVVWVAFHGGFVVHRDNPSPDVLGEYGYGYPVIRNPTREGIFDYGPAKMVSAFELVYFRVMRNGEVWVRMVFCANEPRRVLVRENDMARLFLAATDPLTGGMASRLGTPVIDALQNSPLRYLQPDPVFSFIELANLATQGLAGQYLNITRRQLMISFMGAHFTILQNFILSTLPTFKIVPDWLRHDALPEWVRNPNPHTTS